MENSNGIWQNRIVDYGTESPQELAKRANPLNWRTHPERQGAALERALDRIGFIDDVIVNRANGGRVIDGHLRIQKALAKGVPELPVKYVELTEEEERFALATLDPLAALAEADVEILAQLDEGIEEDLSEFFAEGELDEILGIVPDMEFKEYDESIADEIEYIECPNCGYKFPK